MMRLKTRKRRRRLGRRKGRYNGNIYRTSKEI